MLADHSSSPGEDNRALEDAGSGSPKRQQYTLKGVEEDAIRLMRLAANRDGMKIGPWVSSILKDAASKSLGELPQAAPTELNSGDLFGAPTKEDDLAVLTRCIIDISNQIRILQDHQVRLLDLAATQRRDIKAS